MRFPQSLTVIILVCRAAHGLCAQSGDLQPAMIAQGGDSVAAKLHYPEQAKAQKKEAAVQFYCEVGTDGHARDTIVVAEDPFGPFRKAVEKAIQQGRFTPARAGGKSVPAMVGGTVFFLSSKGQPTMLVSLTSADKSKAASGANYSQPQMLRSYAELERGINKWWSLVNQPAAADVVRGGANAVEVMLSVDANGNLTGTKVTFETHPNGGLGAVVAKACEGAKFIPAYANGKRVAGQMNLPVNFKMVRVPGEMRRTDHSWD